MRIQSKDLFAKYSKISDTPVSFKMKNDVAVIGKFHNAIEGALRWNATVKDKAIRNISPDDMFLSVEPGNWHIMHLASKNDKYVYGVIIWHESLYLDLDRIKKRSAKTDEDLSSEFEIDINRVLGGKLTTEIIGGYGWGSLRTLDQDQDKKFIEQYVTSNFQQNDILLSYQNQYILPNCHCFFAPPREFLNYFIPIARKSVENLCATVQNIDNELRTIYQAESAKQAFEIINICDQKWGPEYKYFLDMSKEHWKIGQKVQKKKSTPDYRDWLRAKDSIFHEGNQLEILEHSMNQHLDSGEIGFCINEGIVCSWRGDDHMQAKIFFDGIGRTPRAKALILKDD